MVATISIMQKAEDTTYVEENGFNRKQERPRHQWWVVVRLVTCILCLVPAGMQLVALYRQHYTPYRSRVELNIEYPENVSFPAITVCNMHKVQMTQFCKKHPDLCRTGEQLGNKDIILELNYSDVTGFEKNASLVELSELGQEANQLIQNCMVFGGQNECGEPKRIYYRAVPSCFTFFSAWGEKDYRFYGNYKTDIWLRLNLPFGVGDMVGIDTPGKIIVHDPSVIPDPLTSGQKVEWSTIHKVHIRKMTHVRLPPPYPTACKRYDATKTHSQSICYSKCLQTVYENQFGCLSSPAPQAEPSYLKPCTGKKELQEKDKKEIENACDSQCGLSCREDIYDVNMESQRIPRYKYLEEEDDNDMNEYQADIWINFETNAHEIYSHKPKSANVKSWTKDSVLILWGMLLLLLLVGASTSAGQLCLSRDRKREVRVASTEDGRM